MLSKTEMIWRHLLVGALDEERRRSSITKLGQELGLGTTTIHRALERPRSIGAVLGSASGLRVVDPKRLLLLWAATRDLAGDIVYSTRVRNSVAEIEARLPPSAIPTAFTAFVRHEGRNLVADYDQVVVYGNGPELRGRIPMPEVSPICSLSSPIRFCNVMAPSCRGARSTSTCSTFRAGRPSAF